MLKKYIDLGRMFREINTVKEKRYIQCKLYKKVVKTIQIITVVKAKKLSVGFQQQPSLVTRSESERYSR